MHSRGRLSGPRPLPVGPRPVWIGAIITVVVAAVATGVFLVTADLRQGPEVSAAQGEVDDVDEVTVSAGGLIYLDRAAPEDPSGLDAIISVSVAGADRSRLYEARGIQSFAVLDRVLVVSTVDGDGTSIITIVSRIDGTTDRSILPAGAVIDQLAAAPAVGLVGFTLSTPEGAPGGAFTDALFQLDLTGEQLAEPVLAVDGASITTNSWVFLPGTGTMAVHTATDDVLLVDTSGDKPVETLGSFVGLDGASPDGSILVVSDEFGALALSLADESQRRLEAAPVRGSLPSSGEIILLDDNVSRVQRVAVLNEDTGRFASFVVIDSGEESRVLYESPDGRSSVEGFSVSPDGKYVAVAIVPNVAASVSDGHPLSPMSTSVTTRVIDIESGRVLSSVDGFGTVW